MIDLAEFITRSRDERRAHLDLNEPCVERGGNSTNHKGVLAQYLNTTIPSGRTLLCHACNNAKCSNPKHLYWGTDYDNIVIDGKEFGTHKNPFERRVEKHGYEKACAMNAKPGNTFGSGNKGKSKSEEHKLNLAKSARQNPSTNGGRKPAMPFEETLKIYKQYGIRRGAEYLNIGYDAFKSRVILAKKKLTSKID